MRFDFSYGPIVSSKYNPTASNGFSNVTVNLGARLIPGDNLYSIDVYSPSGYLAIPYPDEYALSVNLCAVSKPGILGFAHNQSGLYALSPLTGVAGERAFYNRQYSLLAKLNGLIATLNNSQGTFTCNLNYGENVVKVLIDLINQFISFIGTEFSGIVSQLNAHEHYVNSTIGFAESMSASGTTITAPTVASVLATDKTDLEAGKAYINDSGELMV